MSVTTISIRLDKKVKNEADALFSELGLNMTSAINVFLRQAIRSRKIPFEITSECHPNDTTAQAIRDSYTTTPQKVYYDLEEFFTAIDQEAKNA